MVLNTLLVAVLSAPARSAFSPRLAGRRSATGAIVIEGFILSAIASVVIGVVGSHLLDAIPAIGHFVAVRPTPGLVVATALAAIALGILGSFYPAWLATRQSPAINAAYEAVARERRI
jgi:putative ABC transport system permease protein